ncbi:hypothetical protein [Nocardia sp. NPDC046763]|uniref:hypothetical protein n=1 Tax=Nocardia sp. NPDC046763 TaxID=3155256 RepID=UPI0033D08DF1
MANEGWLSLLSPSPLASSRRVRHRRIPSSRYIVNHLDTPMEIPGGGGYAQARQVSVVEVDSSTYTGNLVLHGEPFTMG